MWVLAQVAGNGVRGGTLSGATGYVYFLLLIFLAWAIAWAVTASAGGRGSRGR